jgi:hypothetical protein
VLASLVLNDAVWLVVANSLVTLMLAWCRSAQGVRRGQQGMLAAWSPQQSGRAPGVLR